MGGNGGIGGVVYIVVDKNMNFLDGFRKKVYYRVEAGKRGFGLKCVGRNGCDLEILVLFGIIICDSWSKIIIVEIMKVE